MPSGGMDIQFNDISTVKRFDLEFDTGVFDPVAGATLYAEGTILGRVTADSKLRPWTAAGTHGAGTAVMVGVLGTDRTSNAVPDDENIEFIVAGGVYEGELIIDGAAKGAGITELIKDQLRRETNIIPLDATDLSLLDNS